VSAEPADDIYLQTAIDAVRRAGEIQRQASRGTFEIRKKGTIDLVTEVDVAVEQMVRALIAERYPDHDVLGEELGGPGAGEGSRYCWICDPLDGTTNFAHGLPLFCSTIALEVDGELRVGAVYDPTRDELFTAIRGGGAFLNGEPIRVSTAATLIDSLLVTGFPYSVQEKLEEMLGLFGRFLSKARAVRRLGSAALDMCYVAAGRLDGFWEEGLNAWDIAGGVLIVQEAGGRITSLDGGPFVLRSGRIIASNGLLHDQMRAVIADYYASRK
jgi:myo-inositol-1(or 4)-monophosphatase